MRSRTHQRGVALIMAMLIVALAVIMATQIGFDSALEQRRTVTALTLEQSFQVGLGAEAWAAKYLQDDATADRSRSKGPQDHFAEKWAKPMPPIPIDGGQIEGGIEDLQGKFNLNNLVFANPDDPNDPAHKWYQSFQRLLTALELEPKWADVLRDWLDSDTNISPDGAEDDTYLSQNPPYRASNSQIVSVSELLALPEFGLERYRKLKPYVSALPALPPSKINVCTAPGIVIDSLKEEGQVYGIDTDTMVRSRKERCFPDTNDLGNDPRIADMIMERSEYFRLTAFVTIGGTESSLYSLLYRNPNGNDGGRVRTIMRSFGPE